jgi:DNA-directed RNA polymerase subunit L
MSQEKLINFQFPYQDTWDLPKDHLKFELKDLELGFVNSLERILLSNIPTVGFHVRPLNDCNFNVLKNNTPFENEFITHRIGCIPVHVDPETFDVHDHLFIINVENDSKDYKLVTSGDFEVKKLSENRFLDPSKVRKIFPSNPLTGEFIPITKIIPWEDKTSDKPRFHCEGKCIIGEGLQNGCFSQVAAVAHSFKVDPERHQEEFQKFKKELADEHARVNKVLKDYDPDFIEESSKLTEADLKMKFETSRAERCYYRNTDDDPYWYDMIIESIGILSPLLLLEKGLEQMIKKVNLFKGRLETPVEGQLVVTKGYNAMDRAYCIRVYNENETLGNLIATHLQKYYIEDDPQLTVANFNKVHPLENSVLIYLNPNKERGNDWGQMRELIYDVCHRIVNQCRELIDELRSKPIYKAEIGSFTKKLNKSHRSTTSI